MNKHTSGPWVANITRIESKNEHGWANDGWIIADCQGPDSETNARLIAAAPELLEALETLVTQFGPTSSDDHVGLGEARAAIAKAKGEI